MKLKHFSLLLLLLGSSVFAAPQQLYKVELIIFAHITPAALNSEQWPANPTMPTLSRIRNLQAAIVNNAPASPAVPQQSQKQLYQIMSPTQLDLTKVVMRLKKSKDYPPLVHVAWLQPGLPVKNSPRIHLYGGQAYDVDGKAINAVTPLLSFGANENGAPATPAGAVTPSAPQSVNAWEVNGYVRISRPYLFQIDADLALTIPRSQLEKIVPSAADNIKTDHFVMKQTFRLKLSELYYIDNPLFGVLVRVDKYPQKKK